MKLQCRGCFATLSMTLINAFYIESIFEIPSTYLLSGLPKMEPASPAAAFADEAEVVIPEAAEPAEVELEEPAVAAAALSVEFAPKRSFDTPGRCESY